MGLRILVCGAVVAALPAAGCSATGTTGTTPSKRPAIVSGSAPGSSSAASSAELAREQASAAYVGMWRDMAEAAKTSDWRSPLLGRYATGDALSAISRGLYADHRNGLVAKGAPKNYPKMSSATPTGNPTAVVISDCGDSTNWLRYRKDTGELADDESGGRRAITAEVKKQPSGSWKVAWFAVKELGSC